MLLIEQGRHEMAEDELRQALVQQPNDSRSHALLALCLVERKQFAEASEEAGTAIHLSPDDSFAFYIQAHVFRARNLDAQALEAIRTAIELNPENADYYALLASLHLQKSQWKLALDAANEGLQFDPENVDCNNARARALTQLGRPRDAEETFTTALARDPENATSHALYGWTLIDKGQYQKAMEHFREALRLEPELELARAGIIEALKAKRILYRPILKYFLWMSKLKGGAQWGILMGLWFLNNILRRVANANPQFAPWITPLLVAYTVFAFTTWMAVPLFNLMLFLDPFGRLALSREEKITAAGVGVCVLGALVSLAAYFAGYELGLYAAIVSGFLIPPLSRVYHCEAGWPRGTMAAITAGLFVLGLGGLVVEMIAGNGESDLAKLGHAIGGLSFLAFVIGALASQFAANYLVGVRPRR